MPHVFDQPFLRRVRFAEIAIRILHRAGHRRYPGPDIGVLPQKHDQRLIAHIRTRHPRPPMIRTAPQVTPHNPESHPESLMGMPMAEILARSRSWASVRAASRIAL